MKQTWNSEFEKGPHEANFLKLDCSKIKSAFGWKPTWKIDDAVEKTVEWTEAYIDEGNVSEVMDRQRSEFFNGK
jgi:CDP-glucose 4,6-dehydratase